jgi:hypothetical protein
VSRSGRESRSVKARLASSGFVIGATVSGFLPTFGKPGKKPGKLVSNGSEGGL